MLFAVLMVLGSWDALRGGAAAQWSILPWVPQATATDIHAAYFPLCGAAQRYNCVVDGDTFWFQGEKIRVLGIDAPEVSAPGCAREAELGDRATVAFRDLLNAGPFSLSRDPLEPDRDRYERLLRRVTREGKDLGERLFSMGLAKKYRAAGPGWCEVSAI